MGTILKNTKDISDFSSSNWTHDSFTSCAPAEALPPRSAHSARLPDLSSAAGPSYAKCDRVDIVGVKSIVDIVKIEIYMYVYITYIYIHINSVYVCIYIHILYIYILTCVYIYNNMYNIYIYKNASHYPITKREA